MLSRRLVAMKRDVILPFAGGLDASADVSGCKWIDLMPNSARYHLTRTYGTDLDGFTPRAGTSRATGRMDWDMRLPFAGDLDSSSDISGHGSMDLMSRPARDNPKRMCVADFDGFAPPGSRLSRTGKRWTATSYRRLLVM